MGESGGLRRSDVEHRSASGVVGAVQCLPCSRSPSNRAAPLLPHSLRARCRPSRWRPRRYEHSDAARFREISSTLHGIRQSSRCTPGRWLSDTSRAATPRRSHPELHAGGIPPSRSPSSIDLDLLRLGFLGAGRFRNVHRKHAILAFAPDAFDVDVLG